jgi:phage tail-like protein
LVGVIESTTQRLDERIRLMASFLDPATAPIEWLDFVARWLDLPWDDELPVEAKRAVLGAAGTLVDRRGTRDGVQLLVRNVLAGRATVTVTDVTVDYAVTLVGGAGRRGTSVPALLAGTPRATPTLNTKAVLGRARLCSTSDPLAVLAPTLRIEIVAPREARRPIDALLDRVLAQYIPAGVATRVRWVVASDGTSADDDAIVIDATGPGRVGRDSEIGRTILVGRKGRLDEAGFGIGFRLQ